MKIALVFVLGLVCLMTPWAAARAATEPAAATPAPAASAASAAAAKSADTARSPDATKATNSTGTAAKSADAAKATDSTGTAAAAATAASAPPTLADVMKDPQRKVGFIRKFIAMEGGPERAYQVWVPLTYTADKKWPVILFLHGLGESGSDGNKPLANGLPKEITRRQGNFDFIVVIPQVAGNFGLIRSPDGGRLVAAGGWGGPDGDIAMAALARTLKEYSCDADRVYLTGLSMGGYGTYTIALKHPKKFAAIVPICGGGDPATGDALGRMPIWIWHGAADPTVAVANSRDMVEGLVKAKAVELRYTELPGVGHNSWDKAYASDELYAWLLAHKLSDLAVAKPVKPVLSAPAWDKAPKIADPDAPKSAEPAASTTAAPTTSAEPRP